jgi:hypothetical protein
MTSTLAPMGAIAGSTENNASIKRVGIENVYLERTGSGTASIGGITGQFAGTVLIE